MSPCLLSSRENIAMRGAVKLKRQRYLEVASYVSGYVDFADVQWPRVTAPGEQGKVSVASKFFLFLFLFYF